MNDPYKNSESTQVERSYSARVNRALGIFLVMFGGVILFSVFLTESLAGKVTNLTAGLVIAGLGAGFLWKGRSSDGRGETNH